MNYDRVDSKNIRLVSFDFAPKCIRPDSLLNWPAFDNFFTVLESVNSFLTTNPELAVVSCETIHLRVEKDHIREPERSDYFQTGEILRPFVKGLRIWVQPKQAPSPPPDQISYVSFVPKVEEKEGTPKSLVELTSKINHWLKQSPIPGRIVSLETLQIRGVQGQVNVDMTSWREEASIMHIKQSFLHFFRIFFVLCDEPIHQEVGFADFFPRTLEGVGIFRWPVVQRLPDVMTQVNEWMAHLPASLRLLNIQTLLCRSDYRDNTDAYKTFYWDEFFHVYHKRVLRAAYVITNRNQTNVPRFISTKLFAPGVIRDPKWYRWSGAYETQEVVKQRMDDWVRQTQARVIAVETLSYKTSTGAEMSEGFVAMHTWNGTGRHGPKQEQYVICLRLYVESIPDEPKDFFWPKTLVDWKKKKRKRCC